MAATSERDALVGWMHARYRFEYDDCDHGTYRGGAMDGEPYAMCERHASALLTSDWLIAHDAEVRADQRRRDIVAVERQMRPGFDMADATLRDAVRAIRAGGVDTSGSSEEER